MKNTVAFFDTTPLDQAYFQQQLGAQYQLTFNPGHLTVDTAAHAAAANIVSTHISSQLSAEVLARLSKLRHIACRSTGFDHVDLAYAKAHHLTVSTVPSYGETTVAEYAFLLLLAVSRRLLAATGAAQTPTAAPAPEALTGHDLTGKTLGVIGTGRIGRHAARLGRGFGMTVVAYDPFPNDAAARKVGFTYLPLDQLLAQADCLTLHAPATPDTHHLLSAAALAKTKPGVLIVNTARGSLIDTPALVAALQSGHVGGAGLDVFEGEEYLQLQPELQLLEQKPIGESARAALSLDALTRLPNVLITAHNAYNSAEALDRIRATTTANIQAFTANQPQNLVVLS